MLLRIRKVKWRTKSTKVNNLKQNLAMKKAINILMLNLTNQLPMKSEIWIQNYYRRQNEETERMNELGLRLNGSKPVTSW